MKRVSVIAVAAFLFAAAPAAGKGVVGAKVCGADACREVKDQALLERFAEGGAAGGPPSVATGWYRVTLAIGAEGEGVMSRDTMVVMPDRGIIRSSTGHWVPVSAEATAAYRQVTQGLTPLPPEELGLRSSPPAPDRPSAGDGHGGLPWVLVLAFVAAAGLGAIALTPPVRRRLGGTPSSS